MSVLLIGFFLFMFTSGIYLMYLHSDGRYLILGLLSLFSLGYYVLPVFFMHLSDLSVQTNYDIMAMLLLNILFFVALFSGYILVTERYCLNTTFRIRFDVFDLWISKYPVIFFSIAYAIWMAYFLRGGLTSYGSEDIESYFSDRDPLEGFLARAAATSISMMSLTLVICFLQRRKLFILLGLLYLSCVALLLTTAQRLAVIGPLFMLIATLSVFGYQRSANRIILFAVMLLLLISPLMVFVREFQGATGYNKFFLASESFSYGAGSIVESLLASILGRADLLNVSIYLKNYIDANGFVQGLYYESILASFVPKFIWADKPYPLSDDGTIWGEISVLAWQLMKGNSTGSLSAFGAISAYREGGWWWTPINGFFTGALLAYLYFLLTRCGLFGRMIFSSLIVVMCIRNVPPSFFQLLVFLVAPLYVMVVMYLLDKYLSILVFKVGSDA